MFRRPWWASGICRFAPLAPKGKISGHGQQGSLFLHQYLTSGRPLRARCALQEPGLMGSQILERLLETAQSPPDRKLYATMTVQ